MRWKSQVRFLEEAEGEIPSPYSTIHFHTVLDLYAQPQQADNFWDHPTLSWCLSPDLRWTMQVIKRHDFLIYICAICKLNSFTSGLRFWPGPDMIQLDISCRPGMWSWLKRSKHSDCTDGKRYIIFSRDQVTYCKCSFEAFEIIIFSSLDSASRSELISFCCSISIIEIRLYRAKKVHNRAWRSNLQKVNRVSDARDGLWH